MGLGQPVIVIYYTGGAGLIGGHHCPQVTIVVGRTHRHAPFVSSVIVSESGGGWASGHASFIIVESVVSARTYKLASVSGEVGVVFVGSDPWACGVAGVVSGQQVLGSRGADRLGEGQIGEDKNCYKGEGECRVTVEQGLHC